MTGFKIVDSSPAATAVSEAKIKAAYPFEELSSGKSFLVPITDDLSEVGLRNAASRASKKYNCKFRVIKHAEPHNCYEVARIG